MGDEIYPNIEFDPPSPPSSQKGTRDWLAPTFR